MPKKELDLYPGLNKEIRKFEIKTNYKQKYSPTSLILMFFIFAIAGFVWEVVLNLLSEGFLVNKGTTYGPWLQIYGYGGVLSLVLLKKFEDKPLITFILLTLIFGAIEYMTSFLLEFFRGYRWWDYSDFFLNINGRICLEGLITFGLGGCACIYIVAPRINGLLKKIPKKIKIILCIILVTLFAIDTVVSNIWPRTGRGITHHPAEIINDASS